MNKPLLKQALDALEYSFVLIGLELNAAVSSDDRSRTAKKRVAEVGARLTAHGGAIDALRAEIAKPEQDSGEVIAELERLYKNAIKREFDLSQALEAAVDNNLDKLMAMSDEQIRALAGFEGHHPDDLAALARQTFEIALLKNKQRNCSRHPDAPHGFEAINEMTAVADRHAHVMAMWLELVCSDYGGKFYDSALQALGEYRMAMNAIHERESPTFMGEPVLYPHIPAPRGFIAQPSIDGVVRTNTTNCNRHPDAPHGPDGAGCKCHSWSPGDAS